MRAGAPDRIDMRPAIVTIDPGDPGDPIDPGGAGGAGCSRCG